MDRSRFVTIPMAIALVVGLSGCGGGGADSNMDVRTTTTGKELTDLKDAYERGAISQEDYEKQQQRILERNE